MPASATAYSTAVRLACAVEAWERNYLLLHAAGLLLAPGKAVLALAPSGGGKSTLTDLSGLPSLSDETVLVDLGPPIIVHGLPFQSASRTVPTNTSASLVALLFLEKSEALAISPLPKQTAVRKVVLQIYTPSGSSSSAKEILRRAGALVDGIRTLRFRFPKSRDIARGLTQLLDEHLEG